MERSAETFEELVVVGAGAAGMCAMAAGRQRGWEPPILEADSAFGGAWRHMPPDVRCLSPRVRDRLPDRSIPVGDGPRPTAGEVLAAIVRYAERHQPRVRFGTRARALHVDVDCLRLETDAEPVYAKRLVVASGEFARPFVPELPGTFAGEVVHTRDLRSEGLQAGERVVGVGGGNSGAEAAVALAAGGAKVTIATRKPLAEPKPEPTGLLGELFWALSGVPVSSLPGRAGCTDRTPIVDRDLWDAVEAGTIATAPEIVELTPGGVTTRDGGQIAADRIVWATGYRRDTDWLQPAITPGERGIVDHDRGISLALPNVGLLGIPCQRTRRSGFLRGFWGDARHVVGRLP